MCFMFESQPTSLYSLTSKANMPKSYEKRFSQFAFSRQVVVYGGYLGQTPWVPDLLNVPDHDDSFIVLKKWDRKLAEALGLNMNTPRPLEGVQVIDYITQLRDKAVDKLIFVSMSTDDPMAEYVDATALSKGREKYFSRASIPSTITIAVEELVKPNGLRVGAIEIEIVPTPRRGINATVKFTTEFMNWLASVTDITFASVRPDRAPCADLDSLPTLPSPIKWRVRGNALTIYRPYVSSDGKQRTAQKTVAGKSVDPDIIGHLLPDAIESLQQECLAGPPAEEPSEDAKDA